MRRFTKEEREQGFWKERNFKKIQDGFWLKLADVVDWEDAYLCVAYHENTGEVSMGVELPQAKNEKGEKDFKLLARIPLSRSEWKDYKILDKEGNLRVIIDIPEQIEVAKHLRNGNYIEDPFEKVDKNFIWERKDID